MTTEEWVAANLEAVARALARPEAASRIYEVLGGRIDPERRRAALERELARLRLSWKPHAQTSD
jgi:hypothetical protein